jgi:hypothetical protein
MYIFWKIWKGCSEQIYRYYVYQTYPEMMLPNLFAWIYMTKLPNLQSLF